MSGMFWLLLSSADVIVTSNMADFPEAALEKFGLQAQLPDEFLSNHLHLAPGVFLNGVRKVRGRLKNPPYTIDEYLETLNRQGLVSTVSELREYANLL